MDMLCSGRSVCGEEVSAADGERFGIEILLTVTRRLSPLSSNTLCKRTLKELERAAIFGER
ncbi:hypothetical protein BN2475_700016 [Paraburkholderia ribeironis]|uniref:Uncharacterized protein n=1 Tax=Paraburkholderia ribeironis TaxID=1247936 RepID=A0A1N7SHG7_9BURK|nr:hypothetical protein BN2475_700016 [Paraburkholderia ribeironis]